VFGTGIFDEPEGLRLDLLIGYIIASLALTMLTLIVWRYGKQVKSFIKLQGIRSFKFRNLTLNGAKTPDEEAVSELNHLVCWASTINIRGGWRKVILAS
jgi:hypothetical protein